MHGGPALRRSLAILLIVASSVANELASDGIAEERTKLVTVQAVSLKSLSEEARSSASLSNVTDIAANGAATQGNYAKENKTSDAEIKKQSDNDSTVAQSDKSDSKEANDNLEGTVIGIDAQNNSITMQPEESSKTSTENETITTPTNEETTVPVESHTNKVSSSTTSTAYPTENPTTILSNISPENNLTTNPTPIDSTTNWVVSTEEITVPGDDLQHSEASIADAPGKEMSSGIIALVMAIVFAVVVIIVYMGLLLWRRYLEYRYGNRELLVNDLEFDTNDLRHFEL